MGHIALARWADLILIAPASADILAKLAQGRADDLLSTLCLAATVPLAVAPAMNVQMWGHAATQANMSLLGERGVLVWGPDAGGQACGEHGLGRMREPEALLEQIKMHFTRGAHSGLRVLITAGPTKEAIDPVRFLSNCSSGKMGYALARAWRDVGAEVILVTGPVALAVPSGIELVQVDTAQEMHDAVMAQVLSCHLFIGAAAVADYTVRDEVAQKLKKGAEDMTLVLTPTVDIIAQVAAMPEKPFVVGFAAETERVEEYARGKMLRKSLDMIIANRVGKHCGFAEDEHEVAVLLPGGESIVLPRQSKSSLAHALVREISKLVLQYDSII